MKVNIKFTTKCKPKKKKKDFLELDFWMDEIRKTKLESE